MKAPKLKIFILVCLTACFALGLLRAPGALAAVVTPRPLLPGLHEPCAVLPG